MEDRELNQAKSKPDTVNRPVRTARTFVHHYNSTHNTETAFIYIPLPPDNITSHMWPTGGKGGAQGAQGHNMNIIYMYISKILSW